MKFPSMKHRKEIPQMKSELEKVAVALESLAEAFRKLAEDHSDKAVEKTVEPEVTMTIEEVRSILTARSREEADGKEEVCGGSWRPGLQTCRKANAGTFIRQETSNECFKANSWALFCAALIQFSMRCSRS